MLRRKPATKLAIEAEIKALREQAYEFLREKVGLELMRHSKNELYNNIYNEIHDALSRPIKDPAEFRHMLEAAEQDFKRHKEGLKHEMDYSLSNSRLLSKEQRKNSHKKVNIDPHTTQLPTKSKTRPGKT
jgi:hypothetical protein